VSFTKFSKVSTIMLGILPLLLSCGFRDGWGEDEQVRSNMTAEQFCDAREGHSWVDGACQKDSFLLDGGFLNEDQCKKIKEAYWANDICSHYTKLDSQACVSFSELVWHGDICSIKAKVDCEAGGGFYDEASCVDRPIVTFDGPLKQSLTVGDQLTPIAYEVDQGAVLSIESQTCSGFFALKDGKVITSPDYKLDADTVSCEATLVALKRTIQSVKHTVVAEFSTGFLSYCNDPDMDGAIFYITTELLELTKAADCREAAQSLAVKVKIRLIGDTLISRLEPFSGLNNLRHLEIRNHSIEVIPSSIASLSSLQWLDLRVGNISDISGLAGSKTIKYLYLEGNPISDPAKRTEENCPTKDGTNEAVLKFCKGET